MEEPQTIARYRLTGELGRGGMGVVYQAEDPQLGRPVAIKVILFPPEATDDLRTQLERRFEREARSAAGIRHPGVVTVHDFGRDGDYLYLVMELVAGQSLADRLKSGWLPERAEAFEIVAKVADGLAAAHAAGVVHRDVTPRNILMAGVGSSPDGGQTERIVVTDFGIARSIGEETYELTRTGMLVGSPSFMAPEQVRNKDLDERADVFSLGVVLYLLLTGKLPFHSNDLTSLLYQIVHEDPFDRAAPNGTKVKGKLGLGTVEFLQQCLAKEAADRVQTAAGFARQARRLGAAAHTAELEETVALGALARERAGRKRPGLRRRRGGWAVAGLALIAAAAAGIWAFSGLSGGDKPASAADGTVVQAGRDTAPDPIETATEAPPALTPISGAATEAGERSPELGSTEASAAPRAETAAETANEEPPVAEDTSTTVPPLSRPAVAPPKKQLESRPEEPQPPAVEPAESPPEEPLGQEPGPPPDTFSPVLDIDDMPRGLSATEVVLSGRVVDDRGEVELTVDGDQVPIKAKGEFVVRRPLAPGRNSIAFVAIDAAGNRTMKSVDVSAPAEATAVASPAAGPARPRTDLPTAGGRPGRPRFADRGDGTLADHLTGIMWAKRIEPIAGWKASKSYCKKLELGRHRDWMLPTIEELEELHRSAAGALSFPTGMIWSSTKNGSTKAWAFDFYQGQRAGQPITGVEGVDFKAFCLRRERARAPRQEFDPFGSGGGGQPQPRGGVGGGQAGGGPGGGGPGGGGPGGGQGGGGPGGG